MDNFELSYYLSLSKDELQQLLLALVVQPDYGRVKDIITYDELINDININFDDGILVRASCKKGDVNMVKLLLEESKTIPDISLCTNNANNISNYTYVSSAFREACFSGNIHLIHYLTAIENQEIPQSQRNDGLYVSLNLNNEKIVKHLLDSPNLKGFIKFENLEGLPLKNCLFGYSKEDKYNKKDALKLLSYIIEKYKIHNININNINDEHYGTLLGEFASRADKEAINLVFPYFKNEKCKIEEAIVIAAFDRKIENVEYLLLNENTVLTKELKNKIYYANDDVKNLIDKIEFNEKLHMLLNNKELESEGESRGKL